MAVPTIAELRQAKSELMAKSAPLHKEKEGLRAKIDPLKVQLRAVNDKIIAIERPALSDLLTLLAPVEAKEAREKARNAAK